MRAKSLLVLLAILVSIPALALLGPGSASADTPTPIPGLNLWIGVAGLDNCSTKQSDASCDLAPGTTFVIDVHLDPLPSSVSSYGGFDVALAYEGVTANQDVNMDIWPDCAFPAQFYDTPGRVQFGCVVGVPPASGSTYSGVIGTNSFVCAQSGSVELIHGVNNTDIVDFNDLSKTDAESVNTSDKLTINCAPGGVQPPVPTSAAPGAAETNAPASTPLPPTEAARATAAAQSQATTTAIAKATAAKKTPGGTTASKKSGGGGLSTWAIVAIIAGGVAAAGALGGGAWWYMQSRRAAGGGGPPTTT